MRCHQKAQMTALLQDQDFWCRPMIFNGSIFIIKPLYSSDDAILFRAETAKSSKIFHACSTTFISKIENIPKKKTEELYF